MRPQNKRNNNNSDKTRINETITAPEVMVILDGGSTEVCATTQALQMARDMGLDLVEVSPNTNPPVCKMLDYGKFKYAQNKKNKHSTKKKQLLKEIRMQPKISDHDLKFKTAHVQQFLEASNKVKVTIRFKGRELAHTELGEDILRRILDMLTCNYVVDKQPSMEGRMMSMMLSPSSKHGSQKKKTETRPQDPQVDTEPSVQTNTA